MKILDVFFCQICVNVKGKVHSKIVSLLTLILFLTCMNACLLLNSK